VDYFLVDANGQSIGPYSLDQLRSFWADGKITRETPVWTRGMEGWQPIRTIENSILPPPQRPLTSPAVTSPTFVSRLDQPKAKRSGCTTFLTGCLIATGLPALAIVLLMLLGAHAQKTFWEHLTPEQKSKLITLAQTKAKADATSRANFDEGFKSGYQWGYACGLTDYNHGALKEPSDQLEANARGLSEGDTDAQHRAGFVSGIQSGYDEGWKAGGK
jgi:GYF domain 2